MFPEKESASKSCLKERIIKIRRGNDGQPRCLLRTLFNKMLLGGETRGLNIQRASDGLARERKMPVLAAHIFPETRRGVALIFFPTFFPLPAPRPVLQPRIFSRTHARTEPGKTREKNTRAS